MDKITELRQRLDREMGKKDLLLEQVSDLEKQLSEIDADLINHQKARIVVQTVAEQIQKRLEFQISNLVSLALASVFPDPYEFKAVFVPRRNKTECDFIFSKRGKETDNIKFAGGFGVADVAAFALKMACWSIQKTRPAIVVDEPTPFLHNPVFQEKASELFKKISEELKIQIIIVSDQEAIIRSADKVFRVVNTKGVSHVK